MSTQQPVVDDVPDDAPTRHPDRVLLVARQLAAEYARLTCDKLTAGEIKEALYLAEWQKALSALAAGVDAGKIVFPAAHP